MEGAIRMLNHGVTQDTPKSMMFGAGTIHKGLAFSEEPEAGTLKKVYMAQQRGD